MNAHQFHEFSDERGGQTDIYEGTAQHNSFVVLKQVFQYEEVTKIETGQNAIISVRVDQDIFVKISLGHEYIKDIINHIFLG